MPITNFWDSTISQTIIPSGTTDVDPATASPTDLADFLTWKLEDQVAYIKDHNTAPSGEPASTVIGTGTDAVTLTLTDTPLPEITATGPGIIQPTSGDSPYQPIPYQNLTGSSAGTPSAIVSASAEALFPTLDGQDHTLPVDERPAEFDVKPSDMVDDATKQQFLESFATWDSSYQLEYIKLYGSGGTAANGYAGRVLDIALSDGQTRLTAVVSSADTTKFYIVQSLDKDAIAKMSIADQQAVAVAGAVPSTTSSSGVAAFTALASKLGLQVISQAQLSSLVQSGNPPVNLETSSGTPPTVSYPYIDELIAKIQSSQGSYPVAGDASGNYDSMATVWWQNSMPTSVNGNTIDANGYVLDSSGNPVLGPTGGALRYVQVTNTNPLLGPIQLELREELPAAAQAPFVTELKILEEQLANSYIVSPSDVQQKVSDINDRFNRLFAFWNVAPPTNLNTGALDSSNPTYLGTPDDTVNAYINVISQGGDLNGINQGYKVFLTQEQRIADLANERMQIVRDNGLFQGQHLDVPMLVYKFQSNYSDALDAEVTADTEEVNQQNALLKTYAAIQDIINKTLSAFTKADDGSKALYGYTDPSDGKDATNQISDQDMYILSMFEDYLGSGGSADNRSKGQKSPMETILGIDRPLFNFFNQDQGDVTNYDLNPNSQPQWSTYGTRLSETVTLINQNSQIQMNDINSLSKEKDRHFDLANNALSKMADIISNIARID